MSPNVEVKEKQEGFGMEGGIGKSSKESGFLEYHRLVSRKRGDSEVEQLTWKIENRRNNRIPVTLDVRKRFLRHCRSLAQAKQYPISRIRVEDLKIYHQEVFGKAIETWATKWKEMLGIHDNKKQLLAVLAEAVAHVDENEDEWFHYMDFNMYFTVLEPTFPWLRSGLAAAIFSLLAFYIFTPLFFCVIARDEGICQSNENTGKFGWMSALYFASTTLSTVGYGDLNVSKDYWYQIVFGILYMILANVTLIVAFTFAAQSICKWKWLDDLNTQILKNVIGEADITEAVYHKISRLRKWRLGQIVLTFILLNMLGVFVSRIAILFGADEEDERLSWLESIYWAVQTTTTIGYGDLSIPFHLQWFQILYLILSTYFVGKALGGLASLPEEFDTVRRETAWRRRQVTKSMIDELQPDEHDANVDQYEFLVASLVSLKKISSDDVIPIMDKYRELVGDEGYISVKEARQEAEEIEQKTMLAMSTMEAIEKHCQDCQQEIIMVVEEDVNDSSDTEEQFPGMP